MDRRWRPDRFTPYVLSAAAAATLAAVAATGVVVADGGSGGDGNAMAARAAAVMPFDLAATTHTFTPTANGGVQQVVAVRAGDSANIELVRAHLRAEAARFTRGDFADPATIHGPAMPGLEQLRAAGGRLQIRYEEQPAGARLTYRAADRAVLAALHDWFAAQNADHHRPGMGMGH